MSWTKPSTVPLNIPVFQWAFKTDQPVCNVHSHINIEPKALTRNVDWEKRNKTISICHDIIVRIDQTPGDSEGQGSLASGSP